MRIPKLLVTVVLVAGCAQNDSLLAGEGNDKDLTATEAVLEIPSFSPSDSEVVSENKDFSLVCAGETNKTFQNTSIEYSIVTESKEWGFIWRADVLAFDDRRGRVVCWLPNGAMMGGVLLNSKFLDDEDAPLPK